MFMYVFIYKTTLITHSRIYYLGRLEASLKKASLQVWLTIIGPMPSVLGWYEGNCSFRPWILNHYNYTQTHFYNREHYNQYLIAN